MNESKKSFSRFEFRGMTDCSMLHPSLTKFEVFIFTDRLIIHKICVI